MTQYNKAFSGNKMHWGIYKGRIKSMEVASLEMGIERSINTLLKEEHGFSK